MRIVSMVTVTLALSALNALAAPARPPLPPATPISFRELLVDGPQGIEPSPRLKSLNGKRVRLEGFMARCEEPPQGAFYLCPRPTFQDESGGDTADLPPSTVRVIVRSKKGRPVAFIPRLLQVTGILSLGRQEEPDGKVSWIRLTLDQMPPLPAAGKGAAGTALSKHLQERKQR